MSNKFSHNGFYALHILQNHEIQKQKQNERKSSVISSSDTSQQQLKQNQSKVSETNVSKSINQSKINQNEGSRNNSQNGKSSYADYIAEKANAYRQQKNSRFEQSMQPLPFQNSKSSPKGSNLSIWSIEKENRFEWIGKDQNKHFKVLEGKLKSYEESNSNNSNTQGVWQNLIDKTPQTEQYQKKRSVSKEGQQSQNQNSLRVLFPDQQETPRFNPCFKSVLMKEQINPSKLEERQRERKVQKKHEKNLESYERIENKGIIPDTSGREIVISRRKSTEIKKKYDYTSQVVLKTEEGIPTKYSPSKVRLMYEEAYNNNMNSIIFQTDSNNDQAIVKKLPQSKNIQSISTLNNNSKSSQSKPTKVNNFMDNKSNLSVQQDSQPLKDSNVISKPPLSGSNVFEQKQERKNENISAYNTQLQSKYNTQSNFNTSNNNDKENRSQYQTKKQEYQSNNNPDYLLKSNDKSRGRESQADNYSIHPAQSYRESVERRSVSQQKNTDSTKNQQNLDYQFNQQRQRSNSKKRSSQSDIFRSGDRLWTDIRDQNNDELNRDPTRERVKTNASDRRNYSGNQEFWRSQKQDNIWIQELKLKEIQANNIVLPEQKKVNKRANSISSNMYTESSQSKNNNNQNIFNSSQPTSARQNNEGQNKKQPSFQLQYSYNNMNSQSGVKQTDNNTNFNHNRQNNFQPNDRAARQFESNIRDNSRSCTPKQYDYSPQQRTKTAGDIYFKTERDQTPKQFQNVDFSQARSIKERMQKSQIKF